MPCPLTPLGLRISGARARASLVHNTDSALFKNPPALFFISGESPVFSLPRGQCPLGVNIGQPDLRFSLVALTPLPSPIVPSGHCQPTMVPCVQCAWQVVVVYLSPLTTLSKTHITKVGSAVAEFGSRLEGSGNSF